MAANQCGIGTADDSWLGLLLWRHGSIKICPQYVDDGDGRTFVVGILWVLFGYSMAFAPSSGNAGLLGNVTAFAGLEGLMTNDPAAGVPAMGFVAFQAMFACITVGLIAGAIADRTKFSAWLVFAGLWAVLVYFSVAHWVVSAGRILDASLAEAVRLRVLEALS